jgi:flagellar hook-length control protein FliK
VKATAPISGAANAQNASPAPRANSSLADFLQTGSTQDFKSIAATFFAAPTATPTKTQSALKNSKVENGNDPSKPKLASDPAFELSQLALTVPTIVPDPLPPSGTKIFASQGAPKDDVVPSLPGPKTLADSKEPAPIGGPASLADKAGLQLVENASKEAAVQPAPKREDKKAESPNAVPDQAQTPTNVDAVKHNATAAAKNDAPTLGAVASNTADHTTPAPSPAIDSVPVTPVPEPSSTPPLNATADSLATKPVAQSQSVTPGLAADSKNSRGPNPINGLAKTQNRTNKDSGSKDTRTTEPQTRKSTLAQAADEIASASTVSSAANSKTNPSLSVQTHSISHPNVSTQKQIPGTTAPSIAATEMDGPDEALPTTESLPMSAKFVQGLSQSEFRVGMQSQEFGSIDIRTSVSRHMFSAEISVENSDVAKSMATDLPALHNRLAEQQVPVAHIVIQGQSLATSSGLAQDTQQRAWQPQAHAAVRSGEEIPVSALSPVMAESFNTAGRLDIRI